MNRLLLVIAVMAIIMVSLAVLDYNRRSGEFKCPDITSGQCNDSPTGRCLLACDNYNDDCYKSCNGDGACIQRCYQQKSQCYIACLGDTMESFCETTCGC